MPIILKAILWKLPRREAHLPAIFIASFIPRSEERKTPASRLFCQNGACGCPAWWARKLLPLRGPDSGFRRLRPPRGGSARGLAFCPDPLRLPQASPDLSVPKEPTHGVTPWLKTPQRPRCSPKAAQTTACIPSLGTSPPGFPPPPRDTQGSSGPFLSTLHLSPLLSECSHFPISSQDALSHL